MCSSGCHTIGKLSMCWRESRVVSPGCCLDGRVLAMGEEIVEAVPVSLERRRLKSELIG